MQSKSVSIIIKEDDEIRSNDDENNSVSPNYRSQLSRTKHSLVKTPSIIKRRQKCVDDSLSRKILLIQDILYELPELEQNVVNSISGYKQKSRKSLSARFIHAIFALMFIMFVYSIIFVIGLIISSNLLSPIPITGTVMTNYIDDKIENDLQKIILIPPTEDSNVLKLRGTFKVAYNVYNNTPFPGALSVYMNVSYLPSSGNRSNNTKCFDESAYKFVYRYTYNNVLSGDLDFFIKNKYKNEDASEGDEDVLKKKRFGSLITLEKVENINNSEHKSVHVLETTAYNAFLSYHLAGNKIEIIPKISRGFNRVVLLVTLESILEPDKEGMKDSNLARRMLHDCKNNGYLTLKFDSSLQKFDTMLFSGNMLPTTFLPVTVPCLVSSDVDIADKIEEIAKNQRILYNRQQYILKKLNTALNM
ncbi:hypothetical protein MACJ_001105 [Theileria orientalis]|uniref:Uncharacterized protein n=1 Tax=Theileria orientalis TaxID=68886 RepID=A0A976MA88_THEOR|nr:hypothetical protein MACJ_001105 [Theileria orientalis]